MNERTRRPSGLRATTERAPTRDENQVHATVVVRHRRRVAHVDAGIAKLVLATWQAGVRTHCSCEDAGSWGPKSSWPKGTAQLGFPTFEDARKWMRIVGTQADNELHARMLLGTRGTSRWR